MYQIKAGTNFKFIYLTVIRIYLSSFEIYFQHFNSATYLLNISNNHYLRYNILQNVFMLKLK